MKDLPDQFKIGTVTVSPPTVMAPLAGITDLPLRKIVKKAGAGSGLFRDDQRQRVGVSIGENSSYDSQLC